jgi:hypothetical protein
MSRPFPMVLLVGITLLLTTLCNKSVSYSLSECTPNALVSAFLQSNSTTENKLVFADFEIAPKPGERPVSNRGGLIQLTAYQENAGRPSRYQGAIQVSPTTPELVRIQKDNPNKAASFDYELQGPNLFAGVGLEIHCQADRDKKLVADDVRCQRL